ncbi:nucleotidyltransferase domain-containing protein [Methanosarcinales archaeon]|nr:MAG: nucleotidyltransferase domain-containing protein [Methanosarcinales archaeon]HHI30532.1 nucleotidyltransferase domain-containing protein [Candidatus Methanoperedenaceae archaeon]
MDEKIKHFVEEIKSYLIGIYKERIKQVILYGSYARGDANEDSDIDVLVIVEDGLDPFKVRRSVSDLLLEILLEEGELISLTAIPEGIFNTYNSPFLLNVKEEGALI